jgi:CDP-diacylglycerol--glycerol-3-phosphate 3-phosphatidyltransferase
MMRMALVPVFLVFELLPVTKYHLLFALAVFAAASLTDMLDGRIARSRGLVTDFGKLMDPLADKLLVISALVGFVQLGICDAWIPVIIIARELLVTSIRLVALSGGRVIAANIWGKVKTASQMAAIILTLLLCGLAGCGAVQGAAEAVFGGVSLGLLWAAAGMTAVSGAVYAAQNRGLFKDK